MFRHILPFVLLLAIFFGAFWGLSNTPLLVNRYGAQWLEEKIPGLKVEALHVKAQSFSWPDIVRFSEVTANLRYLDQPYGVSAKELKCKGTLTSLRKKEPVKVRVVGGKIQAEQLAMRDINFDVIFPIKVLQTKVFEGQGMVSVGQVKFYHYELESASVRFAVTPEEFQVQEAAAQLYGGSFQSGQVSFRFRPGALYISWSELKGLDAAKLKNVNRALFEGLSGKLNGTWRLVGDPRRIEVLAIIFSMPDGGHLSAPLLQRLAEKVSQSPIREQILALANSGQGLNFDRANLHIQNTDPRTIALIVEIQNKALGLHLQERIFVPVTPGVKNLLLKQH